MDTLIKMVTEKKWNQRIMFLLSPQDFPQKIGWRALFCVVSTMTDEPGWFFFFQIVWKKFARNFAGSKKNFSETEKKS